MSSLNVVGSTGFITIGNMRTYKVEIVSVGDSASCWRLVARSGEEQRSPENRGLPRHACGVAHRAGDRVFRCSPDVADDSPSSGTATATVTMSLVSSLPCAARHTSKWLARAAPTLVASRADVLREQVRSKSTQPAYEGHIPLNTFESAFLAVGSGLMALMNPRRGGAFVSYLFRKTKGLLFLKTWWLRSGMSPLDPCSLALGMPCWRALKADES